jgi:predicted O-methyltransferase YrrM
MIPEIQLAEITKIDPAQIDLLDIPYEDGALPNDQCRVLLAVLLEKRPKEVLEIGTYFGHTTCRMAHVSDATIHTVDLPPMYNIAWKGYLTDFHLINRRPQGGHLVRRTNNGRIVQHFADTMHWHFANAGEPSFFFIDGSHSYEAVKHDSAECYQLCKGNGVFLWHDVAESHPGVVQLIEEWRALRRNVCRIAHTTLGYYDGTNRTARPAERDQAP